MPRTRTPYPPGFLERIVALHCAGRSLENLAREFEPCVATIQNWLRQSDRDELRRLRPENKQLRMEHDILSKAAAWLAQGEATRAKSSSS